VPSHPAPDISATSHLRTIAWLRWRMFVNGFRRTKTGPSQVGGLILTIVLRLLLWPIFAMMAIGPAVGAGFFAWMAINKHHPQRLAILLGAVAILWQFIAANGVSIAAQLSSFDPASLLRFPLRFGRYLVLRLALGLLTPSTIIGCLTLLASAIGITVADRSLAPAAFVVLAIYAAMNIFFSRMLGVWLERWLSTRRAREVFGVAMALFFVSFQFLNYNRVGQHGRHAHHAAATSNWAMELLQGSDRVLAWLPPGFATNAILPGNPLLRLAELAALVACTVLIFAAFAARLHKQFLGEFLAEGAPRATPSTRKKFSSPVPSSASSTDHVERTTHNLLSPTVAACLRKEWLYIRGNGAMLMSLLTPLIFVFILGRGMLADHPAYILPSALGYSVMGLMAMLYNIFGADQTGVQLYLLAPVRLRDIIIAKNIASAGLLVAEATLAWCLILLLSNKPIPMSAQVSAGFWLIFVFFSNMALGTLRSIQAPTKVSVAQTRKMRPATANKTTVLLVLAALFGCVLLQVPVTMLSRYFGHPWLAAIIFAPLAAAAIGTYTLMLKNADRLMLKHRDDFAAELCGD
jgi:ABC-2 type transport system permease protein